MWLLTYTGIEVMLLRGLLQLQPGNVDDIGKRHRSTRDDVEKNYDMNMGNKEND